MGVQHESGGGGGGGGGDYLRYINLQLSQMKIQ